MNENQCRLIRIERPVSRYKPNSSYFSILHDKIPYFGDVIGITILDTL
jgi:hypothetical protein